jgi:hypothetical protein
MFRPNAPSLNEKLPAGDAPGLSRIVRHPQNG